MANVVFFSFKEEDRGVVLTIKGRAVNPRYLNLDAQRGQVPVCILIGGA